MPDSASTTSTITFIVALLFIVLFFGTVYAVLGYILPWWWLRLIATGLIFLALAKLGSISRGKS
jgi:hypothetical protein